MTADLKTTMLVDAIHFVLLLLCFNLHFVFSYLLTESLIPVLIHNPRCAAATSTLHCQEEKIMLAPRIENERVSVCQRRGEAPTLELW